MKALILAAGFGKRLRPLTNSMPKCMVEVGGRPLIVHALDCLAQQGITEVGIVVGHMAEKVIGTLGDRYGDIRLTYFNNTRYLETNNIYSLYMAKDFCDDDTLLLECDLIYRPEVLARLAAQEGDCTILVSPFDPAVMDGTVVFSEADRAKRLVLGKWQDSDFDPAGALKTVNLYRFSKDFLAGCYMPLIEWYVRHEGVNSYYEKVLGCLIYLREHDIRTLEIPADMWNEIDDAEDLARARRRFGG